MTRETIRVVVCGDDGVGKSSLIVTLMKDKFIPNLQDVLPPLTIPRDFSSSPYSPNETILIDTDNGNTEALCRYLKTANVIWLVYSDHESYERVSFYWMMMFRSLGLNIPVILCKNKCDGYQNEQSEYGEIGDTKIEDEEFVPMLMEFKEIDTCIKASAKTKYDVNQAFYLCQRAITHPIAPLFDARLGDLKPLAAKALERIFLLSDNDQDKFLNDEEMYALQKKCFGKSIDINELEYIKQTLLNISHRNDSQLPIMGELFVPEKGITKDGFLMLNKIYVEKGRHETTWAILRAFRYTDSLCLDDAILFPKLNVPETSSVELCPKGLRFLVDLFVKFDKDNDGCLNDDELFCLFMSSPGLPKLWKSTDFPFSTVVNNRGYITLQGWLAQWNMTTFINYHITTEYLIYFGFEEDARLALQITKTRKFRRRSNKIYRSAVSDRKVFNCFIVGKRGCGKTTLLEMFLGRAFNEQYERTIKPKMAVNSLELKGGKQYYLILQEFGEIQDSVIENDQKLNECDVLCFTYDSSDPESFSYLVETFNRYQHIKNIPVIIVALKADLDKQQQRSTVQPDEFCEKLYISHPLHVSATWLSSLNELFIKITETALVPASSTPGLSEEAKINSTTNDLTQTTIVLGSTIGFLTLLSFTLIKLFKPTNNRS